MRLRVLYGIIVSVRHNNVMERKIAVKSRFNLSRFPGCRLIAIGVIISGAITAKELPETAHVPSGLMAATAQDGVGVGG